MTDDVGEKSTVTPTGDSWLSAALYLLSLWGSHGRSLGIFIPPECKCSAFALQLQRSESGCSFSTVCKPAMQPELFLSIRGFLGVGFHLHWCAMAEDAPVIATYVDPFTCGDLFTLVRISTSIIIFLLISLISC